MAGKSNIEWTDATWNPIRGCSKVSDGCRNCYAEKVANRFSGAGLPYEGLVHIGKDGRGLGWNGSIRFVEEHLLDPLRWKPVLTGIRGGEGELRRKDHKDGTVSVTRERPRRIFVNSMSDLFHENVTDEMLDRIFAVMALCPQHTFQVLTKRPERMRAYWSENNPRYSIRRVFDEAEKIDPEEGYRFDVDIYRPLSNVWLGVSVENQTTADERIPLLLQTPAAVRFVSYEPALGPVTFRWAKWDDWSPHPRRVRQLPPVSRNGRMIAGSTDEYDGLRMLDWIIVGGESGPCARPFNIEWARSTVEQCAAAGVACFVKQFGAKPYIHRETSHSESRPGFKFSFKSLEIDSTISLADKKGGDMSEWPEDLRVRQFPEVQV